MKSSAEKGRYPFGYTQAEFLYFVFIFSILKAKFKNLADFANKHQFFGLALISYVLYTLL
jgi:hypothetical protein